MMDGSPSLDSETSTSPNWRERLGIHRVRVSERVATPLAAAVVGRPTRRRAGVFRRAIRHEIRRIEDPRRILMMLILGFAGGLTLACLLARGEAAGADTRAYWAAGRLWLNAGDPYHPSGPFMPYVYSPWMLPLFVPWSTLPWDVAWFVWRGATTIGLLWTVHWAYKRRPMTTGILLVLLAFPMAANLDTGNINLPLALLIFGAQFSGPATAGLLWMVATMVKWVPIAFLPFISPRGRLWGIGWLALGLALTALTLPQTLVQLQVLFSFQRPFRVDYFVFIWALVPWGYRHPDAFRWMTPSTWPGILRTSGASVRQWHLHWQQSPARTFEMIRRFLRDWFRSWFGLAA